jgi:C1A family cysteine protease
MAKKSKTTNASPSYGWQPDLPDHRDHVYSAPLAKLTARAALPASADLRTLCPPVYDQGQIGSCTANAIAAALEFDRRKQKLSDFVPSRLFIYYNERAMEHTVGSDAGAQIRDGIKSVGDLGACPESEWPYDATPANLQTNVWPPGARPAEKPPKSCYSDAKKYTALSYQRVNRDLAQMKGCLADGFPFVFGFTVYQSFESAAVAKNGVVNMPAGSEQVVGGHAVLAVGYDDKSQRLIVRNSWGAKWGIKGYFTMPYAYVLDTNLSDDFWTIRTVN